MGGIDFPGRPDQIRHGESILASVQTEAQSGNGISLQSIPSKPKKRRNRSHED
jgi:hypothetical protein